jgi:hypothetical protein
LFALSLAASCAWADAATFNAEIFEDLESDSPVVWELAGREPAISWQTPFLGVAAVPARISPAGLSMRRTRPFAVRIQGVVSLPAGEYEFQLRSRVHTRLYVDGTLVLSSKPPAPRKLTSEEIAAQQAEEDKQKNAAAAAEAEREVREHLARRRQDAAELEVTDDTLKAVQVELIKSKRTMGLEKSDVEPPPKMQSTAMSLTLNGGVHSVRLEFFGADHSIEVSASLRTRGGVFALLSTGPEFRYTEKGWADWAELERRRVRELLDSRRKPLQNGAHVL